mmetsp:Transcript_15812/g.24724  ORF Transcript_15812/g.24724 Transcript_15812/m.24724 type:complete len:174 (-) Transcript_15812:35-556(-)
MLRRSGFVFSRISVGNSFPHSLSNQTRHASVKKKVKTQVKEEGGARAREVRDNFVKRVWLLMPKPPPKLSEKEKAHRFMLGKRKVMNELREHNIEQKSELTRIKLKWAAVNALPTPCREAAMIPDTTRLPDIPLLADFPPKLKDPDDPDDWKPVVQKRWKFINKFREVQQQQN